MAQLAEAVKNLEMGQGGVFPIIGAAGTGKSRMVEEIKTGLNLDRIQWQQGNAYSYAQNIPYFPLIDLISKAIQINEGDAPETVKEKLESSLEVLIGEKQDIAPYIGSLFSLDYPEIGKVSPEFWKIELQKAALKVLTALAQRAPTVVCLEDLHWADPSTLELVHFLIAEIRQPVLFLCVYRPTSAPFSTHQVNAMAIPYQELQLRDLSFSEAQSMVASLLKTDAIPRDLQQFIQNKVEGNPFYIEELVNSLIESKTLAPENGHWRVAGSITEQEISSTIQGVISARVDRLEQGSKRILQEASVIGRSFYYEILKRISEIKGNIDGNLTGLERVDLIKTKSIQPYLEYIFKHALTQEVVYNGLLKKERREIHERIGYVIEELFKDRLPEFYETLAFHYKQSNSTQKAVNYLVNSGEKSLAKYAVTEAYQYFQEAYNIISPKENKSEVDKITLVDILNRWAYAYYYLGEIRDFIELFKTHHALADSLDDKARVGMFYAWFGIAHFMAGKPNESYKLLRKALKLGEESQNQKVVGYACTWLPWTCAELGLLDRGIDFAERAQKIAETFPSDQYLYFKSLGGLCYINFLKGNTGKIFEGAKRLFDHGERSANSRCKVFGHWMEAFGHWIAGNMTSSQRSCKKAIDVALDPAYSQFPRLTLGLSYFLAGQFQEAEDTLKICINFCEKRGMGQISVLGRLFLAPTLIVKGEMKQGQKMLEEVQRTLSRNQRIIWQAQSEYIQEKVKSEITSGPKPTVSTMTQNIGFLVKNVPFAGKKAEKHLNKAIESLTEIGAKGLLGAVFLDLGLLHKSSKRTNQARECILEAIQIFRGCRAETWLKQANEALESLRMGVVCHSKKIELTDQ